MLELFFFRRFFFSRKRKSGKRKMPLIDQLSLQNARLVALCGAGGKTSLLYALGREWAIQKEKAVLTTSTHIQAELPDGCVLWDRPDEGDLLSIWRAGFTPVAGRSLSEGKLKGPSEDMWTILRRQADRILVEADGAARRPVKYPAVWEPVIPQYTDRVLVLSGLSALGRPLQQVCHRADLALRQRVLSDGPLTEDGFAALLLQGYGRYAPLYVLNQADDGALFSRAESVAARLRAAGHEAVIQSLKNLGASI
jgi:probable selenium-dependent hydroxylase accessory protein YqeC